MAVVPLCCIMPSKKQLLPNPKLIRYSERGFQYGCITLTESSNFFSAYTNECKRWCSVYPAADISTKAKKKGSMNAYGGAVCNRVSFPKQNMAESPILQKMWNVRSLVGSFYKRALPQEKLSMVCYASESSNSEGQVRLLEMYLAKLKDDAIKNLESSVRLTELPNGSDEISTKKELDSLDAYMGKLNKDATSSTHKNQTTESNLVAAQFSVSTNSKRGDLGKLKGYRELRSKDSRSGLERLLALQQNDETSDLYLISVLVSINIAVFLFEIASPVRNSDFELFSLPLLYGAKINDLILVGEWWRLVTPMFLHSGLFHIALGCWALLTFGPQVCKSYGAFTFFLLYTLGGISGNLISFLHTPGPTVGGTGPVFAIIGAWLIYQIQNKDEIAKDDSEIMFQKAILATALSFIISNFGPIDNWTHFGAAFTGIAYGFFTCPTLQMDDASSRNSQEERITLVRQYANSCKSLVMFTIFIIGLSSLLFVFEPPLDTLVFR